MGMQALSLTSDEIRAIREMPEFHKQLKKIKKLRAKADRERAAEKARLAPCPGAAPIADGLTLRCPKCDLTLVHDDTVGNLYRSHLILMRSRHWNRPDRPDANPFTGNGMWGKAASSYDDAPGDWYMNH